MRIFKYLTINVLLVSLLHKALGVTSKKYHCPTPGIDDPVKIQLNRRFVVLNLSKADTVCVLVHLRHREDSVSNPVNVTKESKNSDYYLAPVVRSYNNRSWKKVAGPFQETWIRINCEAVAQNCVIRIPKIQPYDQDSFFLMAFENKRSFKEELSRFFSQSTFGSTRKLIDGWSYSEDQKGMAQFLKDQIALPMTSLREEFRRGADFSLKDSSIGNAGVAPKHPCQQYSRWRDYAFTSSGDYGKTLTVENVTDGLLVSVEGTPRTIVQSFRSTDLVFNGAGTYQIGYRIGGALGGTVLIKSDSAPNYRFLEGGNPPVFLNEDVMSRQSSLVVVNLPTRSKFESIDAVLAPDLMDTPASSSIRLMQDIWDDVSCDAVGKFANYKGVLGQFPDNTFVWYSGFAELDENTPSSPIIDGGAAKRNSGVAYCSNVPKNFHNAESCILSEEVACDGSPHYYWHPQPSKLNTVVCGSPNEVGNVPNASYEGTSVYQFQGVGPDMFYPGFSLQKSAAWYKTKLNAIDQFRHRVAWALSQVFVVTLNQIDNGALWTEMFLAYEDIFAQNAFGNFKDLLRDVSYSPMMGEMLSFHDSASALYALQREGRVSRPDENFAREIMQLFTIGLYELKMDGTAKKRNRVINPTYDNTDIQTFAKGWTGFQRQGSRSNYEGFHWNPNKIDPMFLNGEKRDPFPKMGLKKKFIGDGYPLCRHLPSTPFLRKGAKYRLVGNHNSPELTPEPDWWNAYEATKRILLDKSSQLYRRLCNLDEGSKCNYNTLVQLERDLECTGVECNVDNLSLVKVQESPPLYYEYMPFPCIELAFSNDAKKVADGYGRAMCADPKVKDLICDSCCPNNSRNHEHHLNGTTLSYCKYSGEKLSYSRNEERCSSYGGDVCDFESVSALNISCDLGIPDFLPGWRWTNQTCSTKVKVGRSGSVSIVHSPNLDINTALSSQKKRTQRIHQPVSPDNTNFFKVSWLNNKYPQIGQCNVQLSDGCLFDVNVRESQVFSTIPSRQMVLNRLKLGSFLPQWHDENYELFTEKNGVETYLLPLDKPNLTSRAIFGILHRGTKKYFLNARSWVYIQDKNTTYKFRNPPSLMKLIEQKNIDAYYETEEILDHYVYHDNTPPFIAKLMIKRLVTSNPSSEYVERVATAFKNGHFVSNDVHFGNGTYGNLEPMFAAILLDIEARSVVLDADPTFGSLKEPIVKLMAFLRAMEFQLNEKVPTIRMKNMINKIGQEPFATPNVFGFFLPDYANPGPVKEGMITSPEAQILNAPTVVGWLNGVMSLIDTGLNRCYGGFGLRSINNCAGFFGSTHDPQRFSRGTISFTPGSSNSSAIVDELALLLSGGRLADSSRSALEAAYDEIVSSRGKDSAVGMIQKLYIITPEFHTTGISYPTHENHEVVEQNNAPIHPYKSVVFINLNGGLDSFNLLIPHSDCNGGKDMFKEYQNVRGSVAVNKNSLNVINTTGQVCNKFGIHEKLPFIHQLYNQGDLSFLANIGVLQQPVLDKTKYRELNEKTTLFAHNTQQEEINAVDIFDQTAGIGVCGRIADVLASNGYSTGTVSVAAVAPAVVSKKSPLLVVNPLGYEKFNPIPWEKLSTNHIKELNMASALGSNVFSDIWSEKLLSSIKENDILFNEMSKVSLSYGFQNNDLGHQMRSIAKLIKTRSARRTDRDVFYAELFGFDTHGKQDVGLDLNLQEINAALSSFVKEMKAQNLWDNVTIVIVSEFGRTLVSNTGNGTDHGWGGNYFIASGSLKGGNVFGEYPNDLTSSGPNIVEDVGIVVPTTSWEAVWNGVAEWFGVNSTQDVQDVLPNRQPFENKLFHGSDLFHM